MINKIWFTFFRIFNRDRIPKLPRVFATRYDSIPGETRYVMRRLGCRDPRGVEIAMRRYGVATVQELIDLLEHQRPRRRVLHRLWLALARVVGDYDRPPHTDDIKRQSRMTARRRQAIQVAERIDRFKKQ